jgi:membrane protease YdiL (CAAX protease family)
MSDYASPNKTIWATIKENTMRTIIPSIKRHPLLTYFTLVFTLSWGSWLVITGGTPMRSDPRFMLFVLSEPVAPGIAGLLMIGVTAGMVGYRDLLARLFHWRVQARWYGMALFSMPLVALITDVLLAWLLRSPEFIPPIFTTTDPLGLLLPGVIGGLLVGVCEELGWTGFANPRLRLRYSIVVTGLLLGVVWGAWHAPLFSRIDSFSGVLPLTLLLIQLFSWLPAYRVLMVWAYDCTGSLLIAILMHASLAATTFVFPPPAASDLMSLISILVSAAIWWLLVAAVVVTNRRQLTQRPLELRMA